MTETQRHAPDAVIKMVHSIMDSRRYKGFKIEKVEYVFFPSAYNLTMSWKEKTMVLKIPSELVDESLSTGDSFKQRKIKKMIKDCFGVTHDE